MSLRHLAALAAHSVSVGHAPPPAVASSGFGRNAALFKHAKGARVGQINTSLLNSQAVMSALQRSATAPAGMSQAPANNLGDRLRFTADQVNGLVLKRQAQKAVSPNYVFSHASAADVLDGATDTVTITNTVGDATLLDFLVADDMDGWDIETFSIGSLGYNMVSAPTRAKIFAASAIHMAQLGARLFARNDTITMVVRNRTGAAGRFRASWPARLVNSPCIDD